MIVETTVPTTRPSFTAGSAGRALRRGRLGARSDEGRDRVDDPDDRVVDRDERVGHRLRGLARGDEVDELARAGHVDRVGRDELAADRPLLAVERLDDEELHALEAGRLHGGDDRADRRVRAARRYPRTRAAKRASAARLSAISAWSRAITRHAEAGRRRRSARRRSPPPPPRRRPAVEEEVALAAEVVGEADLEEVDPGALEPGVGGLDDRGDGGGLDDAERLARGRAALPPDRRDQLRVDVGEEDDVEDRGCRDLAAGLQRLLDVGHRAADEDEVLARGAPFPPG